MILKLGLIFTTILSFVFNIHTALAIGGQEGSGGGGIKRNGRYMTFYSAGFYTEPIEATSDEVPQLDELIHFFQSTKYMTEFRKMSYVTTITPTSKRRYYKVKAESFTPEVRSRLIAEYGRVMQVEDKNLVIFAVTDTANQTTYIFPEYYSLTPIEQMAILFHENYWILNKTASYREVIDAEMSFQAYLTNPNSTERLLRWLNQIGSKADTLKAAIEYDLDHQLLDGLVNTEVSGLFATNKSKKIIYLKNLLGGEWYSCAKEGFNNECTPYVASHINQLRKKSPSLFLKIIEEALVEGNFDVTLNRSDYSVLRSSSSLIDNKCTQALINEGKLAISNVYSHKKAVIPIKATFPSNEGCFTDYFLSIK